MDVFELNLDVLLLLDIHLVFFYSYQSAVAPGMPLLESGTNTAFLSSVKHTH